MSEEIRWKSFFQFARRFKKPQNKNSNTRTHFAQVWGSPFMVRQELFLDLQYVTKVEVYMSDEITDAAR